MTASSCPSEPSKPARTGSQTSLRSKCPELIFVRCKPAFLVLFIPLIIGRLAIHAFERLEPIRVQAGRTDILPLAFLYPGRIW